ncbi:GumC family protein [Fibrella aquatilis]|uniref:Polysaccharide biosynthesis tyrosine autokinase n=1 Tax=Fibrella aquatilis TaxID=2817059 RepID=A0A939G821_9BACT|nr:tyrosine-protein kinase family protein [Fibrella aquatilis]MBO0932085.1 polysaccharide biosynthesis tyrosine autokinase [Fibrella aquatilis]
MTNDVSFPASNQPTQSYQIVEAESPSVRPVLMRYLRQWPWFVLSVALGLAGAYVYLLYKQPTYRSQASLLIMDEKKGSDQGSMLRELQVTSPKKVVENEIEILKSQTLMTRVVDKLHLDKQYFVQTKYGKREVYGPESPVNIVVEKGTPALYEKPLTLTFADPKTVSINGQSFPTNQLVETPYGQLRVNAKDTVSPQTPVITVQVSKVADMAAGYADRLKAEPTSKTSSVVVLTLEDAVPAKGEAILNGVIREYNEAAIVDKNKVARNTIKFIQERLSAVGGELSGVERKVESYKASRGITDLSAQAQTFLLSSKENDAKLNEVNIQLAALNDVQRYISSQPENRGGTPATVGLNDPTLLNQISKMSDLENKREETARVMSEGSPALQTLDAQIKKTKNNISETVSTMKSMLTSSKQGYSAKNSEIEGRIRSIPEQERALMDISRQQAIQNNLYTYLLQKREETAVAFAAAIADTRTVDEAKSSGTPVKPVKPMMYMLFGLLGFLVPMGAIAGRDLMNTRVKNRNEIEETTQIPILGEISRNSERKPLVITSRSRTMIAEQIRTLRANLQFLRGNSADSQVVLVTSSISGEGKTFVSLNLGASLALVDRPTVILEMDLRLSKLHTAFQVDNTVGMSNYLAGEATLDEVLMPMPGQANYSIISSGTISDEYNPAELLSSPRLGELIADLRKRFEYIIIDTPPIGFVSDAQVVAPYADTTLFVVRHDVTPKNYLKMVNALNREQRFNKLNIVLNAVGGNESYYTNNTSKSAYYGKSGKARKYWLS